MTNTTKSRFSLSDSLAAVPVLLAIPAGGIPLRHTPLAANRALLAELVALGWVELVDMGPGAGVHVERTSDGVDAASEALSAAAGALESWATRRPL